MYFVLSITPIVLVFATVLKYTMPFFPGHQIPSPASSASSERRKIETQESSSPPPTTITSQHRQERIENDKQPVVNAITPIQIQLPEQPKQQELAIVEQSHSSRKHHRDSTSITDKKAKKHHHHRVWFEFKSKVKNVFRHHRRASM